MATLIPDLSALAAVREFLAQVSDYSDCEESEAEAPPSPPPIPRPSFGRLAPNASSDAVQRGAAKLAAALRKQQPAQAGRFSLSHPAPLHAGPPSRERGGAAGAGGAGGAGSDGSDDEDSRARSTSKKRGRARSKGGGVGTTAKAREQAAGSATGSAPGSASASQARGARAVAKEGGESSGNGDGRRQDGSIGVTKPREIDDCQPRQAQPEQQKQQEQQEQQEEQWQRQQERRRAFHASWQQKRGADGTVGELAVGAEGGPRKKRKKVRSRQKNLRRDKRAEKDKPAHLTAETLHGGRIQGNRDTAAKPNEQ